MTQSNRSAVSVLLLSFAVPLGFQSSAAAADPDWGSIRPIEVDNMRILDGASSNPVVAGELTFTEATPQERHFVSLIGSPRYDPNTSIGEKHTQSRLDWSLWYKAAQPRYYFEATNDRGERYTVQINNKPSVPSCLPADGEPCEYTYGETIWVDLSAEDLKAAAKDRLRIKFSARSGDTRYIVVSAASINEFNSKMAQAGKRP
jgi:hypothetical protein